MAALAREKAAIGLYDESIIHYTTLIGEVRIYHARIKEENKIPVADFVMWERFVSALEQEMQMIKTLSAELEKMSVRQSGRTVKTSKSMENPLDRFDSDPNVHEGRSTPRGFERHRDSEQNRARNNQDAPMSGYEQPIDFANQLRGGSKPGGFQPSKPKPAANAPQIKRADTTGSKVPP